MLKVVLDTNVYISAILTLGNSREVLELSKKGEITPLISEAILLEIERILRLKLKRPQFEVFVILEAIREISIFVSPSQIFSVIKEDDADNRILECAVEGKAKYIISGDKRHLLPLKRYRGIKILSPKDFLEIFQISKQ